MTSWRGPCRVPHRTITLDGCIKSEETKGDDANPTPFAPTRDRLRPFALDPEWPSFSGLASGDDGVLRSPNILLNTAGVTTIDSSGIGELVSGYTTITNRGGKLKLLNLPPKLEDILQVTQLITVFDVFEDEAAALASFAS